MSEYHTHHFRVNGQLLLPQWQLLPFGSLRKESSTSLVQGHIVRIMRGKKGHSICQGNNHQYESSQSKQYLISRRRRCPSPFLIPMMSMKNPSRRNRRRSLIGHKISMPFFRVCPPPILSVPSRFFPP